MHEPHHGAQNQITRSLPAKSAPRIVPPFSEGAVKRSSSGTSAGLWRSEGPVSPFGPAIVAVPPGVSGVEAPGRCGPRAVGDAHAETRSTRARAAAKIPRLCIIGSAYRSPGIASEVRYPGR